MKWVENQIERMRWREMIKNDMNWIIWTANNIGDSGAGMISEALKTNTTLTKLDLGGDEIEVNEKNKQTIEIDNRIKYKNERRLE